MKFNLLYFVYWPLNTVYVADEYGPSQPVFVSLRTLHPHLSKQRSILISFHLLSVFFQGMRTMHALLCYSWKLSRGVLDPLCVQIKGSPTTTTGPQLTPVIFFVVCELRMIFIF